MLGARADRCGASAHAPASPLPCDVFTGFCVRRGRVSGRYGSSVPWRLGPLARQRVRRCSALVSVISQSYAAVYARACVLLSVRVVCRVCGCLCACVHACCLPCVYVSQAKVDISSPFDGVVSSVAFAPGDIVKTGSTLLLIDVQSADAPGAPAAAASPSSTASKPAPQSDAPAKGALLLSCAS